MPAALELWHIGWFRGLTATGPWALWRLWPHDATVLGGSDFTTRRSGTRPVRPVDDELVAVTADSTVLVDIEGQRRLVRAERDICRVGPAERTEGADAGPYRLEAVDGSLLAICR